MPAGGGSTESTHQGFPKEDVMKSTFLRSALCAFVLVFLCAANGLAEPTLLLHQPAVSDSRVAFVYAGDIWVAGLEDGEARRLTVNPAVETDLYFSPDGNWIAFTGNYDGNRDVYIVSVEGGQPVRLTFHPWGDEARGWTPDGSAVLFRSVRLSSTPRYGRLFTVPREGGFPEPLPMPMAERGSFSPDGASIAYTPVRDAFQTWKEYRGGRTTPIWLFDLSTYDVVEIPHVNASDTNPLWVGDMVWFLSDRNGTMNLFTYDVPSGEVRQVTHHTGQDVKTAAAGPGGIVYQQAGRLHRLDPETGESTLLEIQVSPDLPHKRPHYEDASKFIRWYNISPTGKRAVFGARGEVFTVPAEKGDIRNLTHTVGVNERYPNWSPDGARIACLSDTTGEYQLMLLPQDGMGEPEFIPLGDTTFYYPAFWSPDGKKIAYTDKRLNLWMMDLEKRQPVLVDSDTYEYYNRTLDPSWSPDSKWIAYTKRLDNHQRAVFLYDVEAGETHQVTDGMSDAVSAVFSRDGKYLFFAASTNFALNTGWLDMSSYERPVRRSLYLVVLSAEEPSPFAPESDEETVKGTDEKEKKEEEDKEKEEEEVTVAVDFENIGQRILALPVPERDYSFLQTADEGKLFYLEAVENQKGYTLHRFDREKREAEDFLTGINGYEVSADGKKLLYSAPGGTYGIVETGGSAKVGDGKLDLSTMKVLVDPPAEWAQMLDEAWRINRDFFYDPNMHGRDWAAIREKYRSYLPYVGHRDDLDYLLGELIGELHVGHAYRWGGDYPEEIQVRVGLLGADYIVEDGTYKFARIFTGENWNPKLRAPLTEPGVNVREGEYLLAVNGVPLRAPENLYARFQNLAGRQTVLTVNDRPEMKGARKVTVVPVSDESSLRLMAWVEGNRKAVDEMTGGRAAYVYLPNTGGAGYTNFNRYFYAQLDKKAVILDERFNGGGSVPDYIIDMLVRTPINMNFTREGKIYPSPLGVIEGPKVMIIDEYAGSGGDCLPAYFRAKGLGKLVGRRTWGGLIGIYDYPGLMDGGVVTAPRIAFFGPDGSWTAENKGITPDIDVLMTPKEVIAGHDPQLEAAVKEVLSELETNPPREFAPPEFPDYGP